MRHLVVAERAKRPREFWTRLVRRWEGSGMGQQAFADAAGVSVHTLRYWVAKVREEGPVAAARKQRSGFVEVARVRTEVQGSMLGCRVHIGQNLVVELPTLPPVEWLRALGNEA